MILNDLANEFNPNSPAFGEKYAPPFVPVGFYDWAGNQVNRVYADEFGRYNAMLPSTYSVNLPMPSGVSPNMLVSCMNDAGPIPNPEFGTNPDAPEFIIDPNFIPQYSQFCYTFQYMPGAATYLDTPVVSIAAFANPPTFPVDCEQEDRTPMIASVQRRANSAPGGADGPFVVAGGTVGQRAADPHQVHGRLGRGAESGLGRHRGDAEEHHPQLQLRRIGQRRHGPARGRGREPDHTADRQLGRHADRCRGPGQHPSGRLPGHRDPRRRCSGAGANRRSA